jgi:non-ribosomal peptide synthetase component F
MEIDHQVGLDKNGNLVMNWDSVLDVFPDNMIQEMVDMFRLKVLELSQSLTWNATTRELGHPLNLGGRLLANATTTGLIHSQFIQMAIAHPEYTAIISPNKTITYGELLSMTIQLANHIKKNFEIQHGDLICVSMPRGWEEIVAVISVVLAGGAYVPVDSSLPIERRQAIYAMTKTKIIMTSCELTVLDSTPVLRVDNFFIKDSHATINNIPPQTNSQDDIAYVIFTSGSTGTPKGVVISHRAAVNTISDINQRFSLTCEDRTLALASLSFDLSVWDIFGLLTCGGAIVMPSEDGRRDPAEWVKVMKKHHVTVWNSVPQLVDVVVLWINSSQSDAISDCFASIRLIMMSGDWIPVNLPKNIRELSSRHRQATSLTKYPLRVISLGGATEASIWSVYHEIDESFNLDGTASSVTYGRPLSNQTCHVLDKHLKRCPSHVIGDLYIGGKRHAITVHLYTTLSLTSPH